ncbi:MAG: AAA family ATPase [Proteobacteria bacterium]|nr:AAA family ATPase [Pseudomonadota bacterium]
MNYLRHFGLRESPFGITPDTSFFYPCRSTQEALNTLLIAVSNGEGFIKITGEVGTGKTLLCRKFLATLDAGWVSAYVPNPDLEPRTLLLGLAEELGVRLDPGTDQHTLLKGINRSLLDLARRRKRVVLCMDESQAMPIETLETVRLLTNLETEKRKLLQVVLFGQPELDRRLATPSIRQLRQRITFQYDLSALDRDEASAYVSHRVRVAGNANDGLFTPAALGELHRSSRGIPRLINILAHKSLLLVFGEGASLVERKHVRAAADDTPAAGPVRRWWSGFVFDGRRRMGSGV